MIKEISFKGIASDFADAICPDSDLDVALNLQNVDNSLSPVAFPDPFLKIPSSLRPLVIHSPSSRRLLILVDKDPDMNNETLTPTSRLFYVDLYAPDDPVPIGVVDGFLSDVQTVGNSLVVSSSAGIEYFLFKDNSYHALGHRPPFIPIAFSIQRRPDVKGQCNAGIMGDIPVYSGYHLKLPWQQNDRDPHQGAAKKSEDEQCMARITEQIFGSINWAAQTYITSKSLFWQPFFVRYAFRLFDGSYAWHSAPVLMIPYVLPPFAPYGGMFRYGEQSSNWFDRFISSVFGDDLPYEHVFRSALCITPFALFSQIFQFKKQSLNDWKDIISSLDIFISAPIYTYDKTAVIQSWQSRSEFLAFPKSVEAHLRSQQIPDKIFLGHYAVKQRSDFSDFDLSDDDLKNPTSARDHFAFPKIYPYGADGDPNQIYCWAIPPNPNFHDEIKNCSNFYLYKSIPLKDISPSQEPLECISDDPDLSNIYSRQNLHDDWKSNADLIPSAMKEYNSRLHIMSPSVGIPTPFPAATMIPPGRSADSVPTSVTVWSNHHGNTCAVFRDAFRDAALGDASSLLPNLSSCFVEIPRYIFIPDPDAYALRLSRRSDSGEPYYIDLPLKSHEFLNGAFWFAGFDVDPVIPFAGNTPDHVLCPDFYPENQSIYVSDPLNPFIFRPQSALDIPSGRILQMQTAARPLSQGQFGQFPLYVFADNGIWAAKVADDGQYSLRQPISREICTDPSAITPLDSSVVFPSARGLMILSGSECFSISSQIEQNSRFSTSLLPKIDHLISDLSPALPSDPVGPFSNYFHNAQIAYDYPNQRIIVANPSAAFCYQFSLRSKLWSTVQCRLDGLFNAYPEAWAFDADGNLFNLSDSEGDPYKAVRSIFISRPLKLDAPNDLKTIDAVIVRGNFSPASLKCILYASRDLRAWNPIASAASNEIRNIHGSPYRYFRLVVIASLRPGDYISSALFSFSSRFPARVR